MFASNHKPRRAVTALAIGNVSKQREATNGGHGNDGCATGGCCDTKPYQKPRSHDTSRIAWAKLMARVGEEFPLECPNCGGDIRLREDGRQEPAHFEPEVRKREKARKASPGNGRLGHGLRRRQKNATAGMRGVLANRLRTAETHCFAAQGQSVSRKSAAEVPLTGLSFVPRGRGEPGQGDGPSRPSRPGECPTP